MTKVLSNILKVKVLTGAEGLINYFDSNVPSICRLLTDFFRPSSKAFSILGGERRHTVDVMID